MAANSKIEWTDTSWNPLAGCTRASEGCDFCYAAKMALRLEAMALADIEAGKDPGGKSKYIGVATKNGRGIAAFNGTINLDEDELQRPYTWKKPRRVFVNSMSDLFHQNVPWWFQAKAFDVMRDNPRHTFQVLTKRPDIAAEFALRLSYNLPPNIWIGTSVENQEQADKRIPELLKIPAAVRFLSCEPLLGPIDLLKIRPARNIEIDSLYGDQKTYVIEPGDRYDYRKLWSSVNWVIVGGESGPNARPMHPDWARSIRDQCVEAGVPYFFKQWGQWLPLASADEADNHKGQLSECGRFVKVGKKVAGRLLDGHTWDEFPQVEALV